MCLQQTPSCYNSIHSPKATKLATCFTPARVTRHPCGVSVHRMTHVGSRLITLLTQDRYQLSARCQHRQRRSAGRSIPSFRRGTRMTGRAVRTELFYCSSTLSSFLSIPEVAINYPKQKDSWFLIRMYSTTTVSSSSSQKF